MCRRGSGGQGRRPRCRGALRPGTTDAGTTAADGTYTISVKALQGGNEVEATAMQFGTVSALVRSGSTFLLDLGSMGKVALSDVHQII